MPIENINLNLNKPLPYTPDPNSFSIQCLTHCGIHQPITGYKCPGAHCNGHATGTLSCLGHKGTCSTNRAISTSITSNFDMFEPIRASHINAIRAGIRGVLNDWRIWYNNKYGFGAWENSFDSELGDDNPLDLLISPISFRQPTGIPESENTVKAQQKNALNVMMLNLDIILKGPEEAEYSEWQPQLSNVEPGEPIQFYGGYNREIRPSEDPNFYARHWEWILYVYNQLRKNCICNSDCACNIVCVCHNNCGCNYSDERLKKEIEYC